MSGCWGRGRVDTRRVDVGGARSVDVGVSQRQVDNRTVDVGASQRPVDTHRLDVEVSQMGCSSRPTWTGSGGCSGQNWSESCWTGSEDCCSDLRKRKVLSENSFVDSTIWLYVVEGGMRGGSALG